MEPKILFISPSTKSHRTAEEVMSIGYLASVLRKKGYKVKIINGWLRGLNPQEIVKLISCSPSIVCFSCYRSNIEQAKEILELTREKFGKVLSICGGYGPTFHDQEFIDAGFNVVVRGEAEHIICPLIENLLNEKNIDDIHGISFNKDGMIVRTERIQPIFDLDVLPFPARDELVFSIKRKNPVHICTARGCNGNCSFCSISSFVLGASSKNRWRQRSIVNIVNELAYLYKEFNIRDFKIVDDSFLEPPRGDRWSFDFAEAIIERNLDIRFRTQIRADRITRVIAENLRSCGWFATSIGIENFSNTALRRMNKGATKEDNLRALDILKENDIYTQAGLILFDHNTTMEELEENCDAIEKHNWILTKGIFTEMFAAKGTRFDKILRDEGLFYDGVPDNQNRCYKIRDSSVRRVYKILKEWHKSHSIIYDWVIDSITAPKIMSNDGYRLVHSLCKQLMFNDVDFFRKVLEHIKNNPKAEDNEFVDSAILSKHSFYRLISRDIEKIYSQEGLIYDGIQNSFLS